MEWLNSNRMRLVVVGIVAAMIVGGGSVRADFTFGEPTNLGPKVNSTAEEWDPSISGDGLTLYFSSRRSGGYGDYDLWMATRQTVNDDWSEAINLGRTVNSSGYESAPDIASDDLSLFFSSDRPGGSGSKDLYVVTRTGKGEPWGTPVNLGTAVNSPASETVPSISADGLSLFFCDFALGPFRSDGYGRNDIWVAARTTVADPWGTPTNLGPLINTSYQDDSPSTSADGLFLFFFSDRPGGSGYEDIWFSRRADISQTWDSPVWLGPTVNHASYDVNPDISSDGRTLYLASDRPGSLGLTDLWYVPITPIVDLNGDGIVDSADMCIMIDHWGENYSLCDIGPMPWGDGIVDVKDLIILAEHMYGYIQPVAHWTLNETAGDTAYDKFGKNDALVYGGALWQPAGGKVGGALMFDGIDDYVGTPFILNPGKTSFSVTAWIRGGATGQVIISQADVEGQSAIESGGTWLGISQSDGRLMNGLMDIFFGPLESESVVTDGQWHHVGLVYDYTTMKRHLYVDGAEVTVDAGFIGGVQSTAGLYIGAGQTLDAASFFSGLIDDVRIYDVVLTAEEIAALSK